MMDKKMIPLVLILTLMLTAGPGVPARQARAGAPLPITIGYQAAADWLLLVARDRKLFEKAGLAPSWKKFAAGPPMIAASRDGSIDVADLGPVPFLAGLSQGVEWAIIGISVEGAYATGIAVRKESGIETVADLKGKRIGYFKGTNLHYGLITALKQYGIRPDQVTLVDLPPSAAGVLAALASKEIDAATVMGPMMERAVHEGNAKIITTEGDLGIYTNVGVYAARREWLREKRETAVRFLRALLMAYDLLQKDPGIGVLTVAKELDLKESWVKEMYRDAPPPNIHWWTDQGYRYSLEEGSGFQRRLGYLATFLFDGKFIPKEVDVSKALDASIITEALKTWEKKR